MLKLKTVINVVWRILRLCLFTIVVGLFFTIFGMSSWGGGFYFGYIFALFFVGLPIVGILSTSLIVLKVVNRKMD